MCYSTPFSKVKNAFLDPVGGRGRRNWKSKVLKSARFREEENEPIGETIGREMAKEKRERQNERMKERQTLEAFINRFQFHLIIHFT